MTFFWKTSLLFRCDFQRIRKSKSLHFEKLFAREIKTEMKKMKANLDEMAFDNN